MTSPSPVLMILAAAVMAAPLLLLALGMVLLAVLASVVSPRRALQIDRAMWRLVALAGVLVALGGPRRA